MDDSVIIVGAGIIGAACARALAPAGLYVTRRRPRYDGGWHLLRLRGQPSRLR